jgi:hypothetical protein
MIDDNIEKKVYSGKRREAQKMMRESIASPRKYDDRGTEVKSNLNNNRC